MATALIAILSVSLYASLSTAFRARTSAMAATSQVRKTDLAMDLLAADIRSAVIPNGTLAGTFEGDDSRDARGRDSDTVTFYCTTPSPEPKEGIGDIKQVQFTCEPAADGKSQVLLRLTTTNLLAPTPVQPQREVLCRGVNAFNLRYYDGTAWQDSWDSTTLSNTLPYVIEVTIELVEPDPRSRRWRRLPRLASPGGAPGAGAVERHYGYDVGRLRFVGEDRTMNLRNHCGLSIADCGLTATTARQRDAVAVFNPQFAIRNPQSGAIRGMTAAKTSGERGTVLIIAMWVLLVLAGLALVLARSMRAEGDRAANDVATAQATAVQDGAIQYVLANVSWPGRQDAFRHRRAVRGGRVGRRRFLDPAAVHRRRRDLLLRHHR